MDLQWKRDMRYGLCRSVCLLVISVILVFTDLSADTYSRHVP